MLRWLFEETDARVALVPHVIEPSRTLRIRPRARMPSCSKSSVRVGANANASSRSNRRSSRRRSRRRSGVWIGSTERVCTRRSQRCRAVLAASAVAYSPKFRGVFERCEQGRWHRGSHGHGRRRSTRRAPRASYEDRTARACRTVAQTRCPASKRPSKNSSERSWVRDSSGPASRPDHASQPLDRLQESIAIRHELSRAVGRALRPNTLNANRSQSGSALPSAHCVSPNRRRHGSGGERDAQHGRRRFAQRAGSRQRAAYKNAPVSAAAIELSRPIAIPIAPNWTQQNEHDRPWRSDPPAKTRRAA